MKTIPLLLCFFALLSCLNDSNLATAPPQSVQEEEQPEQEPVLASIKQVPNEKFSRDSILQKLKTKIDHNIPLTVHVFVPLCDNENQGIVPVSASLGDGTNLKSNLYWGARYGMKSYFRIDKNWKLVHQQENLNEQVLERVVFKRTYAPNTVVYLIADAYQGDKMKECLMAFNHAIAGKTKESLTIDNKEIGIYHNADLIGFNGHNGLMDTSITPQFNKGQIEKDAVVIACISNDYFLDHLLMAKAYPLLLTTNLLAPEAYVMGNIIDSWANLENGEEVRENAGRGYNQYQKCGLNGAKRLFQTGW